MQLKMRKMEEKVTKLWSVCGTSFRTSLNLLCRLWDASKYKKLDLAIQLPEFWCFKIPDILQTSEKFLNI